MKNHRLMKIFKNVVLLGFLTFFWSCEELVEVENISDRFINVIAPSEGLVLEQSKITYTWQALSGAKNYHLQVATPNFKNAAQVVIDTLLTGTNYSIEHSNGSYQWRIRGENSDYKTAYSTQSFKINAKETDLASIDVLLLAPKDAKVYKTAEIINFSWESVLGAGEYLFQIATPDFENTKEVLVNDVLTKTSFSKSDLAIGAFQWRVKARNTTSSTDYTVRNFTVEKAD